MHAMWQATSADDRSKINQFCKNANIVEFHDNIWHPHKKYIQISTTIPGSGSVNREIAVKFSEMSEVNTILLSKTNARVLVTITSL